MTEFDAAALIGEHTHVLTSDYFSFLGSDDQGRVAFAIDNNRGRDGDSYEAEHTFVVLHDELQGWQPVLGRGRYDNPNGDLLGIPDSEFFRFSGHPATGITITSPINQLSLVVEAVPRQVPHGDEDSIFHMGSASAVLTWNHRTIHGRVIYEYLVKRDFDLMKNLGEFQGLYLLVDQSSDLYVHRSFMGIAKSMPDPLGFSVIDGEFDEFENIEFTAKKRGLTAGLYRWPKSWSVHWEGRKGPASLDVELVTQKIIGNWVVAGFAMGIVSGELAYDGRRTPVYGLSEIIMMPKLAQILARFRSR